MKVYGTKLDACTQAVFMVLAEKGHQGDLVVVDAHRGEDTSPEHRRMQPFGEIPALDDDGFLLYESRAIMRYLDHRLPGPALTPVTSRAFGRMEQWINVEQSHVSGPVITTILGGGPIYAHLMRTMDPALLPPRSEPASLADAHAELATAFDIADAALAEEEHLAGAEFTLADISWLPYVQYLFVAGAGELVTDRPNLASWWDRVSTRPTWTRIARALDVFDRPIDEGGSLT